MRGGRLIPFLPQEISGYSTPVITEHLPTGSITYNANGVLDVNLQQRQTGGRYRRSMSKRKSKKKRTIKKRTIKKHTNKKKHTKRRY